MPLMMAQDTRLALGDQGARCESRSLLLNHFREADDRPPAQLAHLEQVAGIPPLPHKQTAWWEFLLHGLAPAAEWLLFGQLKARLMIHDGPASRQYAPLAMDHLTGLPIIPGSTLKGCARRLALQELREVPDPAARMAQLCELAMVFGWIEADWLVRPSSWNDGQWLAQRPDLAWACGDADWESIGRQARDELHRRLGLARPETEAFSFGGLVNFLPGYPLPEAFWPMPHPDLEVEVALNHHPAAYRDRARNRREAAGPDSPNRAIPDLEDPRRDLSLAVAPGLLFVFPLLPAAQGAEWAARKAQAWLRSGLEVLGLGARTQAGYGWFDCADALQNKCREQYAATGEREREQRRLEIEAEARRRKEEEQKRLAVERQQMLEQMNETQQEDFHLSLLADDQFRSRVENFNRSLNKKEQLAVIRALRGPRMQFWEDLKLKCQKGGHWAQVEQAVRAMAKKANLGKMP